jgi:putative transcriptional regulator
MTITHHPSDATLGALASGALDEARGLVVATHLSLCAPCRRAART